MYIRRFQVAGYKSFIDPVELHFTAGLQEVKASTDLFSAIRMALMENRPSVNGSRVLGELLFQSSSDAAAGFIEFTLEFTDHDGLLARTSAAGDPTVEIRRRYDQIAKSTYYMNRLLCRRAEIEKLLLPVLNTDGLAVCSPEERLAFTQLSAAARMHLWESTAGFVQQRLAWKNAIKAEKVAERNAEGMQASINQFKRQQEWDPLDPLDDAVFEYERKLLYMEKQLKKLRLEWQKRGDDVRISKELVIASLEAHFWRLNGAFKEEMLRWTGWDAKLEMTKPNYYVDQGMAIKGLPKQLTEKDRIAVGWAFWTACMRAHLRPVSILNLDAKLDSPHGELIQSVLRELAPAMQIIVLKE